MQTEPVVELHGTLDIAELSRFQYFHTLRGPWVIGVFVVLVLILLETALTVSTNPEHDWYATLTNATPFILLVLCWAITIATRPYVTARKQFADYSYLREPFTYVFTSGTISATGISASWSIAWHVLKRVQETKSLFVMYYGPNIAVIVPKRFFQSPAEMEKWCQLVLARIAPKRIKRPGLIGRWC